MCSLILILWFPFANLLWGLDLWNYCKSLWFSWGYYGFIMVWDANTSGVGSDFRIYFLLLIIKGFSSSSFSSSLNLLYFFNIWSASILMIFLDNAKGCLVSYNLSLNSEVFTLDVKTSCTLVSVTSSGIHWFVFRKKCCIKISMTNVEWQTSFLRSTLNVPIIIFVWEVVHLINYLCNCLNIMSTQSTMFPFTIVIMDMAILLLK